MTNPEIRRIPIRRAKDLDALDDDDLLEDRSAIGMVGATAPLMVATVKKTTLKLNWRGT